MIYYDLKYNSSNGINKFTFSIEAGSNQENLSVLTRQENPREFILFIDGNETSCCWLDWTWINDSNQPYCILNYGT